MSQHDASTCFRQSVTRSRRYSVRYQAVHVPAQVASSGLPDQAPEGICTPLGATKSPSEVTEPPQNRTGPLPEVTDPTREETDAKQPALDADLTSATCNQQAPEANQEVLHPAEVQQAKPQLMVPIFRRRTCALPVTATPQGPTLLGRPVDSSDLEGPIDLGPSSRDSAEDMIEEDLDKGNSVIIINYQHCTCAPSGCPAHYNL